MGVVGGRHGSSPSRSDSTSHRRPMAASSTERHHPVQVGGRCMAVMIPTWSVPSTSHQARALCPRPGPTRPRRPSPGRRGGRTPPTRGRPEAPCPHAQPAQVLQGIAGVRQLPVDHRPQPVGPDDQGCRAGVAVDDPGPGRPPAGTAPATGTPARRRVGSPHRRAPPVSGPPGRRPQAGMAAGDAVDAGHAPPHCPASRPRAGAYSASQDPAGDRLAGDVLDHHPRVAQPLPGTSRSVTTTCGTGSAGPPATAPPRWPCRCGHFGWPLPLEDQGRRRPRTPTSPGWRRPRAAAVRRTGPGADDQASAAARSAAPARTAGHSIGTRARRRRRAGGVYLLDPAAGAALVGPALFPR